MAINRPTTKSIISTTGWGIPVTDELNRLSAALPSTITVIPTAWATPTLTNGFTESFATRYRKVNDVLQMKGRLSVGTIGQTMFTLPIGFRVAQDMDVPSVAYDGARWVSARLYFGTSGIVQMTDPSVAVLVSVVCMVPLS